jgi:hypothetical protein
MQRKELIKWFYEHQNIKKIFDAKIYETSIIFHHPQPIGLQIKSIEKIKDAGAAYEFETKYSVVLIWKERPLTQVTII